MPLTTGARLGPYAVIGALGAGGMGEVYRARDTQLNRDVAIKVLPELFALDQERLARFTREAQTLAALNHPNIAHIHGLEGDGSAARPRALVMELVRSGSAMDPAAAAELIRPYSLVVLPAFDRVVTTNTAMHEADGNGRTVQLWRLSDLKLLRTMTLPPGPAGSEHQNPGELKLLADGRTILVHTFSCGLYQLDGVETDQPSVRHRLTFKDTECAVPLRIGTFWVQTLSKTHALASFDLSDPAQIREVSRLTFDDKQTPHWISADQDGGRIVMNSGEYGDHRLFIVNFDKKAGKLALDTRFRDPGSDRPGVSMDGKSWPHGFRGDAYAHGAVFARNDR